MSPSLFAGVFATVVAATVTAAQTPLAYRFRAGEELVYELQDSKNDRANSADKHRHFESHARWRVFPVRENADGGWRLVVQTHARSLCWEREEAEPTPSDAVGDRDSDEPSLGTWKAEPEVGLDHTHLGWVDLRPDGSYEPNPTTGYSYFFALTPDVFLWPLPPAEATAPVTLTGAETGTRYTLTPQADGDRVVGSLERDSNVGRGTTHRLVMDFDTERGRPTRQVETITKPDDAEDAPPRTITVALVDTEAHGAEWAARFEAAAERHFDAAGSWQDAFEASSVTRTAAACEATLDRAREALASALDAAADDPKPIRAAYESLLAEHDRIRDWEIDDARDRERVFALPAVDWRTTTIDGEPRTLRDYRGRVVVLDFWYRGCTHCVKALPKVAELAERYADRPVTFLGVNRDRDLADARVVLERVPTPFEHVRDFVDAESGGTIANWADVSDAAQPAEPQLSRAYRVTGWPKYLVLAPNGRVAAIRSGAAGDVAGRLSEAIDAALASSRTPGRRR